MQVKTGYLLISDISGYTEFLVESELQHAKEILDTLLKTGVESIKSPIRVLNTRGDAVLAFVDESEFLQPQSLLESIKSIYFDFRRQLDLMLFNSTCPCRACVNMAALDLKLFLHYGEYIEQTIGDAIELQGADVILVNRLMKNNVKDKTQLNGYALISQAAVDAMQAQDLCAEMIAHVETYPHFDRVKMCIWDLENLWASEKDLQRTNIIDNHGWVHESIVVKASPWHVWDVATDRESKRIYYGMISVDRIDDLGTAVGLGSQYHCRHEMGDVRFTITDWYPPHHFTSDEVAFDIPVRYAMQIQPEAEGSSIHFHYSKPDADDIDALEPLFRGASIDALVRLAKLVDD